MNLELRNVEISQRNGREGRRRQNQSKRRSGERFCSILLRAELAQTIFKYKIAFTVYCQGVISEKLLGFAALYFDLQAV